MSVLASAPASVPASVPVTMPVPNPNIAPIPKTGIPHRGIILVVFCVLFVWICGWLFYEMIFMQKVRRKLMVSVDPKETFYDSMLCYAYPIRILSVKTLLPNVVECEQTAFLRRIVERMQAKSNQYISDPMLRPCIYIQERMRLFNITPTPENYFIELETIQNGDVSPFAVRNQASTIQEPGMYWCLFYFP